MTKNVNYLSFNIENLLRMLFRMNLVDLKIESD